VSLVLMTGAAGRIGTVLRGGLPELGWAVRCLDIVPLPDERPGEEQVVADGTELSAVLDAAQGVDAVVHLAAVVGESTWEAARSVSIEATYCTLEAARRAGVQRVVLASSNHATGFTPRPAEGLLRESDAPPRPDTYYGVAKVTMEALGSLYADRYGMDVVCLRIGSAFPEPTTLRMLATWLSPADTVSLVDAALTAPSPGFSVVWGVSANTRNWWDLTAARALGYEPEDDAEVYAEALIEAHGEPDPTDPVLTRVGGQYTLPQYDADSVAAAGGRR
jgi:uronate dehydrogenase